MIIWMGWFCLSVVIMGFLGARRYSVSNRLAKLFVEIPADQIRAYEALWMIVEGFLVLSDESIWKHNAILVLCGTFVLLLVQFLLMRIAGKVTSGLTHYVCERRLRTLRISRKTRARMRYAHEFE